MVTWFNIIHHSNTTAIRPVIRSIRSALTTRPAEFIMTEAASHVIAACIFLNATFAARTKTNFVAIFINPFLKLFAHHIIAADIFPVPRFFAVETNFSAASRALQLFYFSVRSFHMLFATGFWAPADQWIKL